MDQESTKDQEKLLLDLDDLLLKAKANIESIETEEELEIEKIRYIGRKSHLNTILKQVRNLPDTSKKIIGTKGNQIKQEIEELIKQKKSALNKEKIKKALQDESLDVTLPTDNKLGKEHILMQMQSKCEDIFQKMGFEVNYPYNIDTDFNNFQSVNIPVGHPARDSWDTFWTEDNQIAITHTSSMQNRILQSKEPPIRAIVPGRCFRNEATDPRHEHTFYQIEGIYVDKNVTFGDMLGTLKEFFSEFFEEEIKIKFSPDFFPFVEPGGMISIDVSKLGNSFFEISKGTGWLEILGCGMIHPKVFEHAKLDPNVYSGFAWGFGLERLIMPKYGIEDVRLFHSGDLSFLRQF